MPRRNGLQLSGCHAMRAIVGATGESMYRWELTFTDGAVFRFVSRAIAETTCRNC